ncbi:hypothetical protein FB639_001642 [Coemansia asiatica]|nr:hypothetical protein FB639_001642 [Coemansia asiatica]
MAIPPADKEEEAHARNIINTLLAGPMEKMSIGDSSKEKGKGKNKAINVASVNDPAIISSNIQSTSALVGHPLVAGHMPLVIEEDYFSDSMDEDDSGEQRDSSKHKQIYYDYSKENAASNSAIRNGRGRGSANRSRGRGRGGNNSNNCTRTDANKDDSGSARGRGRGRGGYVRGRGGHGHGQSQGQSHNASSAL